MNVLVKLIVITLVGLFCGALNAQEAFTITVKVEDIATNDGKMMVALYNSEIDFLETTFMGTSSAISNNVCQVRFDRVPEGVYAVSIFHDKNANGKMDTNFLGIPKEDYGCSNNASGFMGPPRWKDAKFELKGDKTITINL